MSRWISPVLLAAALAPAALAQSTQPAVIVVRVPANAEVVIGTQKMTQTGPERRFVTTPLENGTYVYDVTVSWTEGTKKFKKTRPVQFTPGKTAVIEFNSPASLAHTDKPDAYAATTLGDKPKRPAIKTRKFAFFYSAKVTGLPPNKPAKVWVPAPQSTAEQDVEVGECHLGPAFETTSDKVYGNTYYFADTKADAKGEFYFLFEYLVTRREVKTDGSAGAARSPREPGDRIARYLKPDAKVPIDGKPLELLKGTALPSDPVATGRSLYDVVNNHMRYSKEGTGWGQGDSVWACDSKFGNCTDFHSLFISLARGRKMPAKFEMGYSIPSKRGEGPIAGYHCWAWFMPRPGQWLPVDISEANRHPEMKDYYFGNLTEDRVHFSTGRDIVLEPPQSGPPLNYFIDPYVEVDGRPYPAEKIQRGFGYKDLE